MPENTEDLMPPRPLTGFRIRELRFARQMSQDQLGTLVGTSQRQISKYESGANDPTAHVLMLLAQHLGTTTDYLCGRTDNPELPNRGMRDLSELERLAVIALRAVPEAKRQEIYKVVRVMAGIKEEEPEE